MAYAQSGTAGAALRNSGAASPTATTEMAVCVRIEKPLPTRDFTSCGFVCAGISGPSRLLDSATLKSVLILAIGLATVSARADAPQAATYKTETDLLRALAAGQATPDMLTSPISITDRHRINIVRRTKAAGAVAHDGFVELHQIVEGSGTLVTGGAILRQATGSGSGVATIQNGVSKHVNKGDVILIPAGLPHWYKDLDGTITYLEVRWEEK